MDRKPICAAYPWLLDDSPKNVIMGDDLDAGLSTLLYLSKNPNAKLVGIYVGYEKLFYDARMSHADLENCIYLDLDIVWENCRSLGHHIVRMDNSNVLSGFHNSCNINELAGRSVSKFFTKKYPLGTVHFLLWLYNCPIPERELAENLIWLADSAFINGQSHRFRKNMSDWLSKLMLAPQLQAGFEKIDAENFEIKMAELQRMMHHFDLNSGKGQVHSKHKKLTGFQCQPPKTSNETQIGQYLKNLFWFLSAITGWKVLDSRLNIDNLAIQSGIRQSGTISQILQGSRLDDFLVEQRVFSYVFPFRNSMNYTTGLLCPNLSIK